MDCPLHLLLLHIYLLILLLMSMKVTYCQGRGSMPQFMRSPEDITVRVGETARFVCSAKGDPWPQVSWSMQGERLFLAARERRMNIMPQDSSIYVTQVRREDQGIYVCTAKNKAGNTTTSARLTVIEVPHFAKPLQDVDGDPGAIVKLECLAQGAPTPSLKWEKDGKSLRLSHRHFLTADSQVLVIVHAKDSDSGRYTCTIENELGSMSQSRILTVRQPSSTSYLMSNFVYIFSFICVMSVLAVLMFLLNRWTSHRSSLSSDSSDKEKGKREQALDDTSAVFGQTVLPDMIMS